MEVWRVDAEKRQREVFESEVSMSSHIDERAPEK